MRRRRLLAAVGTCLPLAGCVGTGSFGTPSDGTTTDGVTTSSSTDEATTAGETTTSELTTTADTRTLDLGETVEVADGRTLTVHDVRIRRIVFERGVHTDPNSRSGKQFVVADVSATDPELVRGVSLAVDGDRLDTGANDAVVSPFAEPTGELLGFAVPAPLDADRGAVVRTGSDGATARWSLGADHLDALANPPTFEVRGLEVPEEVNRGATFTATVTVTNSGSGDGTFRAELGATTVSDTPEIRIEVPAGETVTADRTVDPHYLNGEELTIRLNWDASTLERTVSVV